MSSKKLANVVTWGDGTKILYKKKYTLTQKEKKIIKVLIAQGTPQLYRKKLWMQCSTALREMKNNPKYYSNLLEYVNKVQCASEFQISLDLKRTFPDDKRCMKPEFLQKLKNILLCYSIRNSTIGYCQGMNFIVGRLLLIVDNEEEAFWIFLQIVEYILPLNYYSDLAGLLTETTLILFLIKKHLPKLYAFVLHFNFEQSLNNFIHKWLVSLFTQNFDERITMMIWDYLFLEGSVVLSKVAIGLLAIMQKDIFQQNNFEDIYQIFNEKPPQLKANDALLYFIDTRQYEFDDGLISKFREILQRPIIENLQEEKQKRNEENQNGRNNSMFIVNKKKKEKQCNPNWPICNYDTSVYDVPEAIVLKYQKKPNIMTDYYYLLANNYPKSNGRIDEFLLNGDKDVLIERRKHSCFENKIIEKSIVFLDDSRDMDDGTNDLSSGSSNGKKEEDIYDIIKQGEHFKSAMTRILNKYLPKPISEEEIRSLAKEE